MICTLSPLSENDNIHTLTEILGEVYSNANINIDMDEDVDKSVDVEKDTDEWVKLLEINDNVHVSDKGNETCQQNASTLNRKRKRGMYLHPI